LLPVPYNPEPLALAEAPRFLDVVFDGLATQSKQGYLKDLANFARFIGAPDPAEAVCRLIRISAHDINKLASLWVAKMRKDGLSPSTIRRRFAVLSRVFKIARRLGLSDAIPEAELPKAEAIGDRAGPGRAGWERMLRQAEEEAGKRDRRALRDLALLLLLHDRGLRRGEVAALDYPSDFDPARPAVRVLGKGRHSKDWLSISRRAGRAVQGWLSARGSAAGPLFLRCDRAAGGRDRLTTSPKRLTGRGITEVVKAAAVRAGLSGIVRAHGLRHQAITDALDAGFSIRDAMAFSRHIDPRTIMIYDDRRKDVGGTVAESIARAPRVSKAPKPPKA
jgi:integrase/recombinase XerC